MADSGLVDMSSQFSGLPMADLIGSPLQAACDSQVKLASATADFIKAVGFLPPTDKTATLGDIRTAKFAFNRTVGLKADGTADTQKVELDVPLLAIVKIPALAISRVNISFDMEVKSSTASTSEEDKSGSFSADASVGWGPFSMKVHVQGSVSSHQSNTRSSDNSAKYHVDVLAEDTGMPEGLARVLDIMHQAITPPPVKAAPAAPVTPP
jgi:hypothetical protein